MAKIARKNREILRSWSKDLNTNVTRMGLASIGNQKKHAAVSEEGVLEKEDDEEYEDSEEEEEDEMDGDQV